MAAIEDVRLVAAQRPAHVVTLLVQRPLEHRLPCRLFRQIELIRRAASNRQNVDAGRIDAGAPKSEGIALVDEFGSASI